MDAASPSDDAAEMPAHFSHALLRLAILMLLAGLVACARPSSRAGGDTCTSGATDISSGEAIRIMLQIKNIQDRSAYEITVDRYKIGYAVFFKAKDESKTPSFGTVVVDYCGQVLSVTGPL